MTDNTTGTEISADLPEAPGGFSFRECKAASPEGGAEIPAFEARWRSTDGAEHEATWRKKMKLGDRIRLMEAFGGTVTAEGRVAFLAATSLLFLDGVPTPAPENREEVFGLMSDLDDAGLMAWMRAKAEMAASPAAQAEGAQIKATVGN